MSNEVIGLIGLAVLLVLFFLRMPVGMAMTLVGYFGLIIIRGVDQANTLMGMVPFQQITSYTITVIPMFTLMGMIISGTSIGADLYSAARSWFGYRRGGLASTTVIAGGVLGAVTGSHQTSTIVMAKLAIPEMRKYGYKDQLIGGSIAAAAPLAIVIPPSLAFIFYGIYTGEPIGQLFMSGVIPGIILAVLFCVAISVTCKLNPELGPRGPKCSMREKLRTLKGVIPVLILVLLVFGGIYGGFFTATEAGAIGSFGALIIALIKKEMNWKRAKEVLWSTGKTTGTVLLMLIGTYIFNTFMTTARLPAFIASWIKSLNAPNFLIMAAIILMYFILGCFIPEIPMLALTCPIIYPVVTGLGFSGIWFGCIIVLMMTIGAVTPPVGMVAFILSGVSDLELPKIFKGVIPFLIVDILVIILLLFVPDIVTWLPSMMSR